MVDQEKPFFDHLKDLFQHVRRAIVWLLLGMGVAYFISDEVILLLEKPFENQVGDQFKLVYHGLFEQVWVFMKSTVVVGALISLPFWSRELALFVAPALEKKQRRQVMYLSISFGVFGALGVVFSYTYLIPLILDAVMGFANLNSIPSVSEIRYINAMLGLLLFGAVAFELPVAMFFMTSWGWVDREFWSQGRKAALVINAVLSAFLSPPDVVSMLVMMLPIQILYECGILGARIADWRR